MKLNITGSKWDRINRNGINGNWRVISDELSKIPFISQDLNDVKYHLDNLKTLNIETKKVLEEAQRVNRNNVDTNNRLNNIIADSGTSSTEVVDARGGYDVLGERLKDYGGKLFPMSVPMPNSESRQAFYAEMNKKADEIGMSKTHFENSHGLHHPNQRTTAKDILLMGVRALGYMDIMDVVGRREKAVEVSGVNPRTLNVNTSVEISSVNDRYDFLGGKTGTLSSQVQTQNLLSFTGKKFESKWYISSVLNASSSRYTATRMTLNAADAAMNRKIKFTGHPVHKVNGNFDDGLNTWTSFSGNPSLDYEEYFTSPASLKVDSSGTSSQLSSNGLLQFTSGDKYYIAARVKCTRHVSGGIGFSVTSFSGKGKATLERVTDGWEKISGTFTAGDNSLMFVGAHDNADLDGHIDNIVMINLTKIYGAGSEPSKTEMDAMNIMEMDSLETKAIATQIPGSLVSYTPDNLPILFEQNSEVLGYPASVTKVMTAMIMLDNYSDLSQKFMIFADDITEGSGSSFRSGDEISLRDALYFLLLESSNTVAHALARVVGKNIVANRNEVHKVQ